MAVDLVSIMIKKLFDDVNLVYCSELN